MNMPSDGAPEETAQPEQEQEQEQPTQPEEAARPEQPAPVLPAGPLAPILPAQSREDTDVAWGDYAERDDSDRLLRDRPPHWDNA